MKYDTLKKTLQNATAETVIETAMNTFVERLVIASSLGAEDQVITHMALQVSQELSQKVSQKVSQTCRVFVLETGRLHQETVAVMTQTQEKYAMTYEVYRPNEDAVTTLVQNKGEFSFYDSIENRKECCYIRKVEPLQRVLKTADAWVTGQRKSQSVTRSELDVVEWDDTHQKVKFNPLANWTDAQVWTYIKENKIPYNALHDKGYPSIGCEPCTRAIKPGEDARSGRWWWESEDQKECGLH
jgi:phosphoadenosine phosphosulfate reductase